MKDFENVVLIFNAIDKLMSDMVFDGLGVYKLPPHRKWIGWQQNIIFLMIMRYKHKHIEVIQKMYANLEADKNVKLFLGYPEKIY